MFFFLLHLQILFYVLSDYLNLAVRSLAELVKDQMSIIITEVVEEDRNPETDRALQVAL